jgi:hypothetical protein
LLQSVAPSPIAPKEVTSKSFLGKTGGFIRSIILGTSSHPAKFDFSCCVLKEMMENKNIKRNSKYLLRNILLFVLKSFIMKSRKKFT